MEPITASIFAKPAIQLVTRIFQPVVKKLGKELSDQVEVAYHRLFGSYTRYLQNTVERHSYFTSVVFKNEQQRLEDFYQPLTLVNSRSEREIQITDYPSDEVNNVQRLLVVDTAGMGKTTLLKFLFLNCVKQEAGIPIFVELRKLSRKRQILPFILDQISDVDGTCKPDLFYKLLSSGEFVFFLDGYDEIPEVERPSVTAAIQDFIQKTPGNKFVLTSRDEAGLVAFPQFQRYTIKPLHKSEAYSLLRKYATPELAELLIAKLDEPQNRPIHEFLTNPLLTSLLFKSFEYKHVIPLKRHIFYRQVYEALYESHDLTKDGGEFQRGKKSGLDIDKLESVLRALGALTYKAGKIEFTKESALDFLLNAKKLASEPKPSTSAILHDLTHAVPLLVIDGNYIRWSHRSIQEYFAAQYICKNTNGRQTEILSAYFGDGDVAKHMNLMLLCADIDKAAFDQSIGRIIASSLLSEFDSTYKEFGGVIADELIEERKALTVGRISFVVRVRRSNGVLGDKTIEETAREFHQRIASEAGQRTRLGTSLLYGDPGLGRAATKIDRLFSTARARIDLPFVSSIETLHGGRDVISPDIDFMKVTDSPSCPLNNQSSFSYVNSLLTGSSAWRFDASEARQFLRQIDDDLLSRAGAEPW